MRITFFDDPLKEPDHGPREDVRFRKLGFFVYPDGRRVAMGFDITPFPGRPSIEVTLHNERGEPAGSLSIIEVLETNFSMTLHLRDKEPADIYHVRAVLYYKGEPDEPRLVVHDVNTTFDRTIEGDQIFETGEGKDEEDAD